MTFVQTNAPLTASRHDEGPALQRRILQDLERQWLESWTVADQLQGGAPASAQTPDAAPESLSARSTNASAANRTAPSSWLEAKPMRDRWAAATPADQALKSAGAAVKAEVSERLGPRSQAVEALVPRCEDGVDPTASTADAQVVPTQGSASMPAWPAAAVALGMQRDLAGASLGSSPVSVKTPLMGIGPGAPRSPLIAEVLEQAQEAEPAPRRNARSTAEEATPGLRRLTLRETDASSVLATMRDAELSPLQSQSAADGLARALMEAGYARVQVVVNGQQQRHEQRHERTEAGSTASQRSSVNETSSSITLQEHRHGH